MSTTHNETEKAILHAAEQEFMLKGYGGARTTAIAEKAGVTHAMLHYYYRTKETLFERIIEEKASELLNQVLSLYDIEDNIPFVDKISHVIQRHFDLLVQNPLLPGFVLTEFKNNPERLDGWFAKMGEAAIKLTPKVQEEIKTAVDLREICDISARQLLTDMLGLNISSVCFADVLCRIYGQSREEYLTMRREENIEVIRKRLMP